MLFACSTGHWAHKSWQSPKWVPSSHWFDSHLTSQTSRQGESRASGCEPFEEKCCRHNETIDPFHKKCLKTKNHRGLEVHFWWSPSIYREIGVENSRDVFLLSRDHALLQRATSDLQKRFLALEFIQRHCQTLMLRISFGLTWMLTPPQPKTWRSMCMCDKLTWTSTHPRTPDVT